MDIKDLSHSKNILKTIDDNDKIPEKFIVIGENQYKALCEIYDVKELPAWIRKSGFVICNKCKNRGVYFIFGIPFNCNCKKTTS